MDKYQVWRRRMEEEKEENIWTAEEKKNGEGKDGNIWSVEQKENK